MAAKKESAVKARERARVKMAAKLAEQRKREEAIEADLATFFETEETLEAAAAERDAAAAKAHREFDKVAGKVTAVRSTALTRIKGRGQSVADIAALTGLTGREVRALLTATTESTDTTPPVPADTDNAVPSSERAKQSQQDAAAETAETVETATPLAS